MVERFNIFYQIENGFVLLTQQDGVLNDVIQELSNYPADKTYCLEKVTLIGSQVINFE